MFISEGTEEMQRVLDCLIREGKKVVLVINCAKIEMITMNIVNQGECIIEGRTVKKVERFKYLGSVCLEMGL